MGSEMCIRDRPSGEGEIMRVAVKRKPEERELVVEGGEKERFEPKSGGRGPAMNDSGSRMPNGEAPAGGLPRAPGRRPGNGRRPRAFLWRHKRRNGVRGLRCNAPARAPAIRFPCGQGRHVRHARGVVKTLARGAAPAHPRRLTVNCGAQHPRRDALEAAVQADPDLRNRRADHRRRGHTQWGALVWMGPEQPGYRATTRCRFVG